MWPCDPLRWLQLQPSSPAARLMHRDTICARSRVESRSMASSHRAAGPASHPAVAFHSSCLLSSRCVVRVSVGSSSSSPLMHGRASCRSDTRTGTTKEKHSRTGTTSTNNSGAREDGTSQTMASAIASCSNRSELQVEHEGTQRFHSHPRRDQNSKRKHTGKSSGDCMRSCTRDRSRPLAQTDTQICKARSRAESIERTHRS